MDPGRRRMLGERALLPMGGVEIAAGLEMRAADADQVVECKGIVRRQVERDLEPLDGRFGIALVEVDPAAAAPRPRRAAVDRERLADDEVRRLEVVQQGEGVAEHGKHRRVAGEGLCLARQVGASRALLHRSCGEMIDDALRVRPCGERGRQRMVGVALHRAFQQVECARISLGIERQDAGHRPERQVVRRRARPSGFCWARSISARRRHGCRAAAIRVARCSSRRRVLADRAIGTVRPQVTAGFGLDQSKGQARLPAPSPHDAGQMVARRSRLPRNGDAGPRQRGGELVGNAAGDLAILRTRLDRLQGDRQAIAAGREE